MASEKKEQPRRCNCGRIRTEVHSGIGRLGTQPVSFKREHDKDAQLGKPGWIEHWYDDEGRHFIVARIHGFRKKCSISSDGRLVYDFKIVPECTRQVISQQKSESNATESSEHGRPV